MFPAPIGNYWRATVTALVAIALLVVEVAGLIHIWLGPMYPVQIFPYFIGMFLLLPFGVMTLAFGVIQMLRHERELRAGMHGDERRTPRAPTQPDPAMALRPTEHLALTRTLNLRATWWQIPLVLVSGLMIAPFVAGIDVLCVYIVSPHTAGWIMEPLLRREPTFVFSPPATLTPLEWIVLGLAVAPGALLALWGLWSPFRFVLSRETIVADDEGISVRRPVSRRKFIPWDDVRLVIAGGLQPSNPDSLLLRGDRHGIRLDVSTRPPPPKANGKPQAPVFRYDSGPAEYQARVQRLMSTVVARAHVPVRMWARQELRNARGRVPLPAELTPDAVLRMPLAPATYQPTALHSDTEAGAASQASETAVLRSTIPFRVLLPRFGRTLLMFGGIFVIYAAVLVSVRMLDPHKLIGNLMSEGWFSVALLVLFLPLSWYMAFVTYRDELAPTVVADANGLQLRKFNGFPSATMLWKDMRAWAVLLPDDLMPGSPIYLLFSDLQTLAWEEPTAARLAGRSVQGDRHEAYVATAEHLHALIAARTGLPLRQIVPQPGE